MTTFQLRSSAAFVLFVLSLVAARHSAAAIIINPGGEGVIGTQVAEGTQARFIEVLRTSFVADSTLHVGELEAFAAGATFGTPNVQPSTTVVNTNDLALSAAAGGSATATVISGTGGHGSINDLISGIRNTAGTTWTRGPVSGEVRAHVDLGATHDLKTVRLWQRADGCCQGRLAEFTVNVYADNGSGGLGANVFSQFHEATVATNGAATFLLGDTLVLGSGDTLQLEIDGPSGMADLLRVGLAGTGTLKIEPGATLHLKALGKGFSIGQTFNVLDFGSVEGQFDSIIQSGFAAFDLSDLLTTGEIFVNSVVPEPGSATLAALGLAGLGFRRRRRPRG